MPDRVLNDPVREDRQHDGAQDQDEVVGHGQGGGPSVLCGDDQEGPVPQIQGVRDQPEELERSETEEALGTQRGWAAPAAMTRPAPRTGTATSAPG